MARPILGYSVSHPIPTRRRLEYARGYLALGMIVEANGELEDIEGTERLSVAVLEVRLSLYVQAKQWDMVGYFGKAIAEAQPDLLHAWIDWAGSLAELNRVDEARAVLLQAEPTHRDSPVLHYNLACYNCLLGNLSEARRRILIACARDKVWREHALCDPDLEALWAELRAQ